MVNFYQYIIGDEAYVHKETNFTIHGRNAADFSCGVQWRKERNSRKETNDT